MRSMALFVIIILALAAVAIAIGVIAYRKRVRKVENGEVRDTHSSIPAPETTVGGVYKIVLMVVAIIILLQVSSMHGEIQSLKNNYNNNINSLQRDIAELRHMMEEKNTRILTFGYEFGDVDYANKTGKVKIIVTLKEFRDDTTISFESGTYNLTLEQAGGGTYTAEFDCGLFEPYSEAFVAISEGGVTTLETIDFPSPVFYEYLPTPRFMSSYTSSSLSFGKLKYEGGFFIDTEHADDIKSATLTYMTSNRDIKTIDITNEVIGSVPIEFEQGLPVENDLSARIEIVTKSGFKIIEQSMWIYAEPIENYTMQFMEVQDSNGNTLWKAEY